MVSSPTRCLGVVLVLGLLLSSCGGAASSSDSTTTVKSIVVIPGTAAVKINGEQTYLTTVSDSQGNSLSGVTVTWSSSASEIAEVNSAGRAIGKSRGTAQITASADGVTSTPSTLIVLPAIGSVTISPISATIKVGQTQQFTATAKDINGTDVTGAPFSWSNSFSGVATIDSNGVTTGVSPGTVFITANLGGVSSPVATLTVTP